MDFLSFELILSHVEQEVELGHVDQLTFLISQLSLDDGFKPSVV